MHCVHGGWYGRVRAYDGAMQRDSVNKRLRIGQVPVAPVSDDGVRAFLVGTLLFAVALVVVWAGPDSWSGPGRTALWACATGVGIGLTGWGYCRWRRPPASKRAEG